MTTISKTYARDGFVFPLDVLSTTSAQAIRADLEAAEAELADDPVRLALLHSYTDRLLPCCDALIHHEKLLAAASEVLGPDLMVWNAMLFVKEAHSPKIVSWHQDLTYWGLDNADQTTCWVALSPATRASGCMKFVAGSHRQSIVPHRDTFADNNLLTRGQEVEVVVAEEDATYVSLNTGQASMHHGHLIHGSDPNTTADRRIGLAIRYIRPSMQQRAGEKPMVRLVQGEDNYKHFAPVAAPKGRLHAAEFARCQRDAALRRQIVYAGADAARGKRF